MPSRAITSQRVEDMRSLMTSQHRLTTLAEVLPTGLRPKRMIELAIQAMVINPDIFDCEPVSIFTSILGAAQMGLEINPAAGSAYLVPYGRKCQLIIGYQGRKDLAYESGKVSSIHADVVREFDEFSFNEGTGQVSHQFPLTAERGRMIASYAVCKTTMGGQMVAVVPLPELLAMRQKAFAKSPWKSDDHFPGMCRVAAMRKLAKSMPRAMFGSKMAHAEALETAIDIGADQAVIIDVPASAVSDITPEAASTADDVKEALRGQDIASQPPPPPPAASRPADPVEEEESEEWNDLMQDATAHSDKEPPAGDEPGDVTVTTNDEAATGFQCGVCGKKVKTARGLTQHMRSMHPDGEEATDEPVAPSGPASAGGEQTGEEEAPPAAAAAAAAEGTAPEGPAGSSSAGNGAFVAFQEALTLLNDADDMGQLESRMADINAQQDQYGPGEHDILQQTYDVVERVVTA